MKTTDFFMEWYKSIKIFAKQTHIVSVKQSIILFAISNTRDAL